MIGLDGLGGYDSVLDVGGNLGDFAELCRLAWPDARITSFEPVPVLANANRQRSGGRWTVEQFAISDHAGHASINFCENQHSASTMQTPGTVRSEAFALRDRYTAVPIVCRPLDDYADAGAIVGRLLVKVDVEGHELPVLLGAPRTLDLADTVIVEVQQDPGIFLGSASADQVDRQLRQHGLTFHGLADAFHAPDGRLLQFDGIWRRA